MPTELVPITDDDAAIAALLEDVSIPTLLLSMVHMTGDTSILDGPLRPAGIFLNEVQGFMSDEDRAAVRAWALDVIRDYRDRGHTRPDPPDGDTVHRMMEFLVAGEVPREYVPLLLEELELDGVDARAPRWDDVADRVPADLDVVVVGAGMSGLLAAIRAEEAGLSCTVVEKNPAVGGTWYENSYPGCRVDVGNHFYCYSFEPSDHWSEFFCQHDELQAYFERTAEHHDLRERIRFETEVTRAAYDEATGRWQVELRGSDGAVDMVSAGVLISAVGQLNRPKVPDIDGVEDFAGPSMHTAAWDHEVDLAGKRVAVIGTGASALQVVPAIADEVGELTVFQRSASWMFDNPHYHEQVGPGVAWAIRHLPGYARWYRFLIMWPGCDGGIEAMRVDPDWPDPSDPANGGDGPPSISAANDAARQVFTARMAELVGDDPDLLAKVVPDYVCLGKRTLQDDGTWLRTLRRDDVALVTDPIARIEADRIVCASGDEHPVDVIVYATGFHANRFLWPMEIVGRDGATLAETWGDDPEAYLGITVPGFPNLFCIYGPGTNLAHGGSIIFHSECQVRYVLSCLHELVDRGATAMEVRRDVHDAYNERLQAEMANMVWTHPSIEHSWYRNPSGKVTVLSPWRLVDYWDWTRQVDPADYTFG